MRAHSTRNNSQIFTVIKLDVREIFYMHGGPRMMTRDLFAVANLVTSAKIGPQEYSRRCGRTVMRFLERWDA